MTIHVDNPQLIVLGIYVVVTGLWLWVASYAWLDARGDDAISPEWRRTQARGILVAPFWPVLLVAGILLAIIRLGAKIGRVIGEVMFDATRRVRD